MVVLLIAGYYGIRALAAKGNGELKASGTIEATMVNISPELAGQVKRSWSKKESGAAGELLVLLTTPCSWSSARRLPPRWRRPRLPPDSRRRSGSPGPVPADPGGGALKDANPA